MRPNGPQGGPMRGWQRGPGQPAPNFIRPSFQGPNPPPAPGRNHEQLERRIEDLERQVRELRGQMRGVRPEPNRPVAPVRGNDRPRDGEQRREGDRPRDGEQRREGDRPAERRI